MKKYLIFFILFFISCKEKKIPKIGVLFEISGKYSYYANEALLGIDFFIKKNKNIPFKVEIFDFKSDSESLRIKIEKILKNDEFLCILGPLTSKFALYASSISEENKIPLITPTATSPFITKDKNYVFSMSYSDVEQGEAISKFAVSYLGISEFAIIYKKEDPYSNILFEEFKKNIIKEGGKILAVEDFDEKEIELKVSFLKNANPPAIFCPLHTKDAIILIEKCLKENFTPIFLGGDGLYSYEIVERFGKYADKDIKVYLSSPFHPDKQIKEYEGFINEFEIEYGKKPNFLSALSYESLFFIKKCFENLKKFDRENLKNLMKKFYNPKKKVYILKLERDNFSLILGI
jgi:branched-chain amino acid transport system substrate-binding protein